MEGVCGDAGGGVGGGVGTGMSAKCGEGERG